MIPKWYQLAIILVPASTHELVDSCISHHKGGENQKIILYTFFPTLKNNLLQVYENVQSYMLTQTQNSIICAVIPTPMDLKSRPDIYSKAFLSFVQLCLC